MHQKDIKRNVFEEQKLRLKVTYISNTSLQCLYVITVLAL